MANSIYKAQKSNCAEQVINIVSILTSGAWKLRPQDKNYQSEIML